MFKLVVVLPSLHRTASQTFTTRQRTSSPPYSSHPKQKHWLQSIFHLLRSKVDPGYFCVYVCDLLRQVENILVFCSLFSLERWATVYQVVFILRSSVSGYLMQNLYIIKLRSLRIKKKKCVCVYVLHCIKKCLSSLRKLLFMSKINFQVNFMH